MRPSTERSPSFDEFKKDFSVEEPPKKSWLQRLNPFHVDEIPVPDSDAGLIPELQAGWFSKLTWGWLAPLMMVFFAIFDIEIRKVIDGPYRKKICGDGMILD